MEREKIITTLEDIADDLGVVCVNELDRDLWHYYGWQLYDKLNATNKVLLLNFLESEYQAAHRISPLIIVLREKMEKAIGKIYPAPFENGFGDEIYSGFYEIANVLIDWLNWVNRYYPPEQSTQELSQDPIKQEQDNEEPVKQDGLPFELNTEEARKYFPRAEKAGYITGHKWIGDNVRLAYFCSKVYPSNRDSQRPTTALEKFFGVKNLSAQITQIETSEPKRRTSIQWRKEIDDAIFYD